MIPKWFNQITCYHIFSPLFSSFPFYLSVPPLLATCVSFPFLCPPLASFRFTPVFFPPSSPCFLSPFFLPYLLSFSPCSVPEPPLLLVLSADTGNIRGQRSVCFGLWLVLCHIPSWSHSSHWKYKYIIYFHNILNCRSSHHASGLLSDYHGSRLCGVCVQLLRLDYDADEAFGPLKMFMLAVRFRTRLIWPNISMNLTFQILFNPDKMALNAEIFSWVDYWIKMRLKMMRKTWR